MKIKTRQLKINRRALLIRQSGKVHGQPLTRQHHARHELLAVNQCLRVAVISVQCQGRGQFVAEEQRHVLDLVQQFFLVVAHLQSYRVVALFQLYWVL